MPGGPEIDVGIQTIDTLLLGEAKWRSGIGASQGVGGTKDQIKLRVEFCEKYGALLYPSVKQFIILLISRSDRGLTPEQRSLSSERVRVTETTWNEIGNLSTNPLKEEFLAHLKWREARSQL